MRRLGAGGSGEVWLAEDLQHQRHVALKLLAPAVAGDAQTLARIEQRCTLARHLAHPHILSLEGLYRSGAHAWIVMEYAAGGDLSRWRGRPVRDVLHAALCVAQALAHVHAAGVIHRDLKPSNVLVTADGVIKLGDIDAAYMHGERALNAVGRGSPYSMSSQQLDGEAAAPTDDIYAFGTLLYELLSGYPPFYPHAHPQRVREEKPAILSGDNTPPRIAHLIERCLAKHPEERPSDMKEIEDQLQAALTEPRPNADATERATPPRIEPPRARLAVGQDAPLRSEWRRDTTGGVNAEELRRQGFRRGITAALLILGLVAMAIVFLVLPKWVEPLAPEVAATQPQEAAPDTEVATEKKTIDFAALARAKQTADELRAMLDERWQKLLSQAVAQWGEAPYHTAMTEFAAVERDYEAREYVAAAARLEALDEIIGNLERRSGTVLSDQLQRGQQALDAGRAEAAQTAFALAAKIDPQNAAARTGLQRATTLDEVLALVARAERSEQAGDLTAAVQDFRKALTLDAQTARAAEGVARVEARMAGDAFASAMARGFAALSGADHAAARTAFEAARRIRPNAPEVAQALAQIEQEQRTQVIAGKLEQARQAEASEQWAAALQEYRAILELDATVAAAKEGVSRTAPRATLNEQLELYLTQPERLFSQPVRAAARDTLARAKSIASPGPVLQQQVAKLADWLARADVPVKVSLQSDNLTQVTVYRVGALGMFAERELELAPGTYTVVGTRPGYRDVRREFSVMPGTPPTPVVIRCEERI